MASNKEDQRRKDVEDAIRSLYDLFPESKYRSGKTLVEIGLEKEIAKRREESRLTPSRAEVSP